LRTNPPETPHIDVRAMTGLHCLTAKHLPVCGDPRWFSLRSVLGFACVWIEHGNHAKSCTRHLV